MSSVALGGVTAAGEPWTYYETIGGGSGAGPGYDGAAAVQCHMTNTLNTPAEAIELQYPLRVGHFQRWQGSGGQGRWRGGDGVRRVLQALAPCEGTILGDRRKTSPYGLAGGRTGEPGVTIVWRGAESVAVDGKARLALAAGEQLDIRTPGGGGYGTSR